MLRTILLEPLFNILLFLYGVIPGGDFGVAIIALTILIRLALWPLVKKQLYQQKAMQDLKPEIEKIKKRTKGDKQKESQQMVELFKERSINPFASLGLAFAQFPILIALFYVLRDVVEGGKVVDTAYGFIQGLPKVASIISNPDAFDPSLFGLIDMAEPSIVLAAAAGLVQYFQAKQLAPENMLGSDKSSKLGFNMTLIFPVVTVAIATQLPAALALYWAAGSAVAIAQQHLVLEKDVGLMRRLLKRGSNQTVIATKPPTKASTKSQTKGKKRATNKTRKSNATTSKRGG